MKFKLGVLTKISLALVTVFALLSYGGAAQAVPVVGSAPPVPSSETALGVAGDGTATADHVSGDVADNYSAVMLLHASNATANASAADVEATGGNALQAFGTTNGQIAESSGDVDGFGGRTQATALAAKGAIEAWAHGPAKENATTNATNAQSAVDENATAVKGLAVQGALQITGGLYTTVNTTVNEEIADAQALGLSLLNSENATRALVYGLAFNFGWGFACEAAGDAAALANQGGVATFCNNRRGTAEGVVGGANRTVGDTEGTPRTFLQTLHQIPSNPISSALLDDLPPEVTSCILAELDETTPAPADCLP